MKKILSIFLFLIYFNNSFTYANKDYNLFLDGKKAYYNRALPAPGQRRAEKPSP